MMTKYLKYLSGTSSLLGKPWRLAGSYLYRVGPRAVEILVAHLIAVELIDIVGWIVHVTSGLA